MDITEWAEQGKDFEALKNGSTWNKIVRWIANEDADHPYMPVRAYEAMKWEKSKTCMKFKACNSILSRNSGKQLGSSLAGSIMDKAGSIAQDFGTLANGGAMGSALSQIGIHIKKK